LHRAPGVGARALRTGLDVEHDDGVGLVAVVVDDQLPGVGMPDQVAGDADGTGPERPEHP
jgi:hypothetical protein